jgi:molybdenum cofactor cytidylyltransferase
MSAVAIVPAAGRAERFGSAKLMTRVDLGRNGGPAGQGEPLINWTLWSLLDGGASTVVLVVAPGADFSEAPLVTDPRVLVAVNENPMRGMFSSIQAGLSITEGDPFIILPGDMPFVSSGTVTEVVLASIKKQRVVVPVYQDQRGHPVAIPSHFRTALLMAPPETTLKHALSAAGADVFELPVSDRGVIRDVDTPADLN